MPLSVWTVSIWVTLTASKLATCSRSHTITASKPSGQVQHHSSVFITQARSHVMWFMNFDTATASSPQISKYSPPLQKSSFAPQTPLAKAGLSNLIDDVTNSKVLHSLPVPVPCPAAQKITKSLPNHTSTNFLARISSSVPERNQGLKGNVATTLPWLFYPVTALLR